MQLTEKEQIILKFKDLSTIKLRRILLELIPNHGKQEIVYEDQFNLEIEGTERYFVKRLDVTDSVGNALGVTDEHTVNGWIKGLIAQEYLIRNSHTSLSAIKKVYKPTPDTRYFLDIPKFHALLIELDNIYNNYIKSHPHTKQTSLISNTNSNTDINSNSNPDTNSVGKIQ
jgi:hypothetical protein